VFRHFLDQDLVHLGGRVECPHGFLGGGGRGSSPAQRQPSRGKGGRG